MRSDRHGQSVTKRLVVGSIAVLAGAVLIFSLWRIFGILGEYSEGKKGYDRIAREVVCVNEPDTLTASGTSTAEQAPISIDYDELSAQGEDIVGWLYCENTPINYPVLQSGDNEYYLRRLPNGEYNIAGSVFMDYRCDPECGDLNTVIYGHNMNDDSMFASLLGYKAQQYYDGHPVMWLFTLGQTYKIELIAGFTTSPKSSVYDEFVSSDELSLHLEQMIQGSSFCSSVDLSTVERIVTLSTCSDENDSERFVVIGSLKPLSDGGGS